MNLSILNDDIIMYIMNYLSDRDKIIFGSINRYMRFFLDKLYYTELRDYEVIKKLHYLERFKRIIYKFKNKPIPNIVTDLIIKCSNVKNLIIPPHIIQIIVCECLYYKIDCGEIKIIINNKICKCKCFPRNDKFYGGAFYRISNNSPRDKFISVDDKDKPKIKHYDKNHHRYYNNIPKNNKSIKRNHCRY
ncbi:f-box repeat-containing protein [Moumouvirus maliensis]|nr:f-box repeat-containing protein [Moumouvirus maliensis]